MRKALIIAGLIGITLLGYPLLANANSTPWYGPQESHKFQVLSWQDYWHWGQACLQVSTEDRALAVYYRIYQEDNLLSEGFAPNGYSIPVPDGNEWNYMKVYLEPGPNPYFSNDSYSTVIENGARWQVSATNKCSIVPWDFED